MSLWAAVQALCLHVPPPFWVRAGANPDFQISSLGQCIGAGAEAGTALDQGDDLLHYTQQTWCCHVSGKAASPDMDGTSGRGVGTGAQSLVPLFMSALDVLLSMRLE